MYLAFIFTMLACQPTGQNNTNMSNENKKTQLSADGKTILTGPIIRKKFLKKNNKVTDREELYLRTSVTDYFIKFCKSKVSLETLEKHLEQSDLPDVMGDKIVSLEVEIIRNGELDNCDPPSLEIQVQSRMGDYILVNSIVK